MKVVLKKNLIEEIKKRGYKTFIPVKKRGYSIDFCDTERNVCVNVGSAKSFNLGSKGFCVNTSAASYPYRPTSAVCFETYDEAITYATMKMEEILEKNTRYTPVENAFVKFIEEHKAFLCPETPGEKEYVEAISKELGIDEEERTSVCLRIR